MGLLVFVWFVLCVVGSPFGGYGSIEEFHFVPLRRHLYFVEDFYELYRLNLYPSTASCVANIYYLTQALESAETNRFWIHPTKSLAYRQYDWANPTLKNGSYPFRREDPPFTEAHYAKYQVLMKMRISLLLVQSYLKLGSRYDREHVYWFHVEDYEKLPYPPNTDTSQPDRQQPQEHYLIRAFRIAQRNYEEALKLWKKCQGYVQVAWEGKYTHEHGEVVFREVDLHGSEMDQMESEVYKIYHQNNPQYKLEKEYYMNSEYPEYNYTRVIQKKLDELETKKKHLLQLIDKNKSSE